MQTKLKDICFLVKEKINISEVNFENYISTENLNSNKAGKKSATSIPSVQFIDGYLPSDTLISNIRPYFKKIWFAKEPGGNSADVLVFRARNNTEPKFLYYLLSDDRFFDMMTKSSKGTKMPRGDKSAIMNYEINLPPLEEQKAIADVLSCIDDKIELNNKINKILEEQAQALFKRWFVDFEFPNKDGNPYKSSGGEMIDSELGEIPKDWEVKSLDEIADFLNGLAMQKFRPKEDSIAYKVIKIRELNNDGFTQDSEFCDINISKQYVVENGDVIFSWSGTLLVKLWTGGIGGLNQHLFKVTSTKYKKWFYYLWLLYHLEEFKAIAGDKATTMGHIKREHLTKAKIMLPSDLKTLDEIMEPMLDRIIVNKIENQKLAELRDYLLPKLMSGEIRVKQ